MNNVLHDNGTILLAGAAGLTRTIAVDDDGTKTVDPPNFWVSSVFVVTSGPCAVSENGRCAGRPQGYEADERCVITVHGGGMLACCGVFDTYGGRYSQGDTFGDSVTMPDGSQHHGSNCPEGVALTPSGTITWQSDGASQGSIGNPYSGEDNYNNGCQAKDLCGISWSQQLLGGGRQICFA